jgi:thioredoxin-like negative regulator of GroEL
MSSKNVKVAAVDVDKYPALSNRFRISALPTIYQ